MPYIFGRVKCTEKQNLTKASKMPRKIVAKRARKSACACRLSQILRSLLYLYSVMCFRKKFSTKLVKTFDRSCKIFEKLFVFDEFFVFMSPNAQNDSLLR